MEEGDYRKRRWNSIYIFFFQVKVDFISRALSRDTFSLSPFLSLSFSLNLTLSYTLSRSFVLLILFLTSNFGKCSNFLQRLLQLMLKQLTPTSHAQGSNFKGIQGSYDLRFFETRVCFDFSLSVKTDDTYSSHSGFKLQRNPRLLWLTVLWNNGLSWLPINFSLLTLRTDNQGSSCFDLQIS